MATSLERNRRCLGRAAPCLGWAALCFAVLFGVWARFAQIERQPIWHDEVYTRIFSAGYSGPEWGTALYSGRALHAEDLLRFQRTDPARGALDTMAGLARDEPQHPPLYYVLARAWMGLLGDGLGALRALSALLSLAALGAMWWLMGALQRQTHVSPQALELGRRRRGLAVALLSLSPFFVIYAGEAREYTLWSVWVLASHGALLRALSGAQAVETFQKSARRWAPYSLLTALGLYTCFSHATVILAQIFCVVVVARGRFNRTSLGAVAALSVSALLFLPWAAQLYTHLDAFRASMDWSRSTVVPHTELLRTLVQNLCRPLLDVTDGVDGIAAWTGLAVCLGLVTTTVLSFARRGSTGARALLLAQLVLPVALLLLPDLLTGGIRSMSTRYLLPSLLVVVLLAAWWLAGLGRTGLRWGLSAAVLVLAGVGTLRALQTPVPWTRALSAALPAVAAELNAQADPLVVGDRERHHPGNLMALANQVGPRVRFVLLDHPQREALIEVLNTRAAAGVSGLQGVLPAAGVLYLYSPIPQLRAAVAAATGMPGTAVVQDLFVELWRM